MLAIYVIEFVLFSVIGWLIDSGYRSVVDKKWINAGYFKGPICPIYGFGALALIFFVKYFDFLPVGGMLLLCWLALIVVEYVGGIFSEKVLGLKLWDYSEASYHLGGHIDVLHSFYWGILVVAFYYLVYPFVFLFEQMVVVPELFDLPVFVLFMVVALTVTVRKDPTRFLEVSNSVVTMTLDQYQQLFPLLKRLSMMHKGKQYEDLKKKVNERLRGMNFELRKRFGK
jgi:uncharacterized membrane protein